MQGPDESMTQGSDRSTPRQATRAKGGWTERPSVSPEQGSLPHCTRMRAERSIRPSSDADEEDPSFRTISHQPPTCRRGGKSLVPSVRIPHASPRSRHLDRRVKKAYMSGASGLYVDARKQEDRNGRSRERAHRSVRKPSNRSAGR